MLAETAHLNHKEISHSTATCLLKYEGEGVEEGDEGKEERSRKEEREAGVNTIFSLSVMFFYQGQRTLQNGKIRCIYIIHTLLSQPQYPYTVLHALSALGTLTHRDYQAIAATKETGLCEIVADLVRSTNNPDIKECAELLLAAWHV